MGPRTAAGWGARNGRSIAARCRQIADRGRDQRCLDGDSRAVETAATTTRSPPSRTTGFGAAGMMVLGTEVAFEAQGEGPRYFFAVSFADVSAEVGEVGGGG